MRKIIGLIMGAPLVFYGVAGMLQAIAGAPCIEGAHTHADYHACGIDAYIQSIGMIVGGFCLMWVMSQLGKISADASKEKPPYVI